MEACPQDLPSSASPLLKSWDPKREAEPVHLPLDSPSAQDLCSHLENTNEELITNPFQTTKPWATVRLRRAVCRCGGGWQVLLPSSGLERLKCEGTWAPRTEAGRQSCTAGQEVPGASRLEICPPAAGCRARVSGVCVASTRVTCFLPGFRVDSDPLRHLGRVVPRPNHPLLLDGAAAPCREVTHLPGGPCT